MTTETTSPSGGAMTVEQATEALLSPAEPQEPEAPAEAASEPQEPQEPQSDADPTAEAPSEPDEANADGETETETDEPALPAVDPPSFWDAEAKAKFAELPPEHQAIVAAQAGKQATEASKAIQQAAEARKAAESQASKVNDLAAALNDFLPKAVETFQGKWDGVDWVRWAQEDPTAAFQGKLQYEADQAELQRLNDAKDKADKLALEHFVTEQYAKLPELAPELVDPKTGQATRAELAKYLVDHGVDRAQLPHVSAVEMSIAHKAMLYDKLKASPPKVQPKTPSPATRAVAKPAAAVTPQNRNATVANRFAQTRSVDDAVALLLAKKA